MLLRFIGCNGLVFVSFESMRTRASENVFRQAPVGKRAGWATWLPLAVLPTLAVLLAPAATPRWGVMTIICAAIYSSFKWISWRTAKIPPASWRRKLAWWLAWPGMDVVRFLSEPQDRAALKATSGEWLWAACKTISGACLFAVGVLLVRRGELYFGGWCGMFGMVFMLHFGIFHLMSCGWRAAGVDAPPIMDHPLRSQTLGEFWGRRWNRAFRDAAHAALFRPIARRYGALAAMWAVFLFSGVVHEAGISVPAEAGYGLPTLYFIVQALAIMFQGLRPGKQLSLDRGQLGQAFTTLVVYLPIPILFHPPFVYRVVVPLMQAVSGG
jgi:hypothetical protein